MFKTTLYAAALSLSSGAIAEDICTCNDQQPFCYTSAYPELLEEVHWTVMKMELQPNAREYAHGKKGCRVTIGFPVKGTRVATLLDEWVEHNGTDDEPIYAQGQWMKLKLFEDRARQTGCNLAKWGLNS